MVHNLCANLQLIPLGSTLLIVNSANTTYGALLKIFSFLGREWAESLQSVFAFFFLVSASRVQPRRVEFEAFNHKLLVINDKSYCIYCPFILSLHPVSQRDVEIHDVPCQILGSASRKIPILAESTVNTNPLV